MHTYRHFVSFDLDQMHWCWSLAQQDLGRISRAEKFQQKIPMGNIWPIICILHRLMSTIWILHKTKRTNLGEISNGIQWVGYRVTSPIFFNFFGGSISEHLQLHFHLFSALVQRGTELFSLKLSIGYLIREYRLSIHPIESFNFHPKIPKSWMFSLWSNAHIHLSLPPALSRPMKTFTRWTFWKFPRYKGHKLKILWKVFSWMINIIIIITFVS